MDKCDKCGQGLDGDVWWAKYRDGAIRPYCSPGHIDTDGLMDTAREGKSCTLADILKRGVYEL